MLAYCYRHYKSDDRSKQFFLDLINNSISKAPLKNEKLDITDQILGSAPLKNNRGRKSKGNSGRNALRRLTHQYSKPALVECTIDWLTVNPDQMIIDAGYRKHLQHHTSKIMGRVRLLHCLQYDIIKNAHVEIFEGKSYEEINFEVPVTDGDSQPVGWWDEAADKSLIMGTYKHGYEKYRLIRNDPALCFYHKLGPMQFTEKVPGSPDSLHNPGSVERHDDASDPEFTISSRKKKKRELDDDDSFIDTDEEKDLYSLNDSPASTASLKEASTDGKGIEPKESKDAEFRWPLATDLNMRIRRLIAAHMKLCEKEYLEIMRAEKDKHKQERLAIIAMERQKKKAELQQKWTKREEADFYRIISNFGACYNREKKVYDWETFKALAKLDKKRDGILTSYYHEFMAMCRKVTGKSTEEDTRKYKGSQLEEISEERATRCMQRIRLLSRIRETVLPHAKLEERLKLCQISPDYPRWWEIGKHDKALLDGVAKHGLWRTEYHVLLDTDLIFKEIVEKASRSKKAREPVIKVESSEVKQESPKPPLNGEHSEDSLSKLDPATLVHKLSAEMEDNDSRFSTESRLALPVLTDDYAHILASWPKDKAIVSHLEKVCQCVIKGEWSKPTRFDITPIIAKLPVSSRNVISTVGQITRNQFTSDKVYIRGEEAASKDFKIKSIDGLKLTVKTETKKRKRMDDENVKKDVDKMVDGLKKKKIIDGVPVIEVHHRSNNSIQIHVPKSNSNKTSHSVITSKPIIHFPANVRVPKLSISQKSTVPTITSPTISKVKLPAKTNVPAADDKLKIQELLSDSKADIPSAGSKMDSPKVAKQPVGIHIDSPNSTVRIVGSKIEVKEKASIKREIDLSEVILKVPDPSKFLPSKEKTKEKHAGSKDSSRKRNKPAAKPVHKVSEPENNYKAMNTSENRQKDRQFSPPPFKQEQPVRSRPERSAKKKAKDSITEITEAEHMPLPRDVLPPRKEDRISRSPHWAEIRDMRSPTHSSSSHSQDYYRYEFHLERTKHSPSLRHGAHSPPPPLHRISPEMRVQSPPRHSVHTRPISPIHHRHIHSPPPHHAQEEMKHLYTEPLSPRHRSRDGYYYSERSRSPLYYDYRVDKEIPYTERDRRSPTFKHAILSPDNDIRSPPHKHENFPYVHLTEPRSPLPSRNRRDIHSPVSQDDRFPYGRAVDWDGARYKQSPEINSHSPSIRSPPIEGYQYKPLSRLTPESKISSVISPGSSRKVRSTTPEPRRHSVTSPIFSPREDSPQHLFNERSAAIVHANPERKVKKRVGETVTVKVTSGTTKNPPLSFYPTVEINKSVKETSKSKPPKSLQVERPVIEIPENGKLSNHDRPVIEIPGENVRTPSDWKTPQKRKGIGLLELKIQGLKKQKLNENTVTSPKDVIVITTVLPTNTTIATISTLKSPKQSKSISDIIDTLSCNAVRTSVISPTQQRKVISALDNTISKKSSSRSKKTLSLDAIAKNLSRSVEQTDIFSALSPPLSSTRVSPLSPTFDKQPHISQTWRVSAPVMSSIDRSVIRTIQRTPDPVSRESCISPHEQTSPLRRVTRVTTATNGTITSSTACTSPTTDVSPSSKTRKSLQDLVSELSSKDRKPRKSPFSPRKNKTKSRERRVSLGFLDRKIEELKEKSLKENKDTKTIEALQSRVDTEAAQPRVDTEAAQPRVDTEEDTLDIELSTITKITRLSSDNVTQQVCRSPVLITNQPPLLTLTERQESPTPNTAVLSAPKPVTALQERVVSPTTTERLLDEKAAEIVQAALRNVERDETPKLSKKSTSKILSTKISRLSLLSSDTTIKPATNVTNTALKTSPSTPEARSKSTALTNSTNKT